jgi:hypothetical protein
VNRRCIAGTLRQPGEAMSQSSPDAPSFEQKRRAAGSDAGTVLLSLGLFYQIMHAHKHKRANEYLFMR